MKTYGYLHLCILSHSLGTVYVWFYIPYLLMYDVHTYCSISFEENSLTKKNKRNSNRFLHN